MASRKSIASVLAYLHELYPTREINATTPEAWALAFSEWQDDELQACAMKAATTPGRTFFPTPGEIAAFRQTTTIIDAEKLLRQISALGIPNPNGWQYPQVWTVRERMGDVIADAYATAGGARCFDENETVRSIAFREFQKSAIEFAAMPAGQRPLLESGAQPRRIAPRGQPAESIANIVTRSLPAGAA